MKTDFKPSVVNIADICARHEVRHVVISPGSRSAPLALSFLRHSQFAHHVVVDERSAGFVALGLAQQTGQPVALVCTSGTAALNYGPAVAEALYQQVPLLVFTADRPAEWIDQNDGQTIRQPDLYRNYCLASFNLPVEDAHPDARWHVERIVSDAINISREPVAGPVHLNVPLREPLYPSGGFKYGGTKIIRRLGEEVSLNRSAWEELTPAWQTARKVLIVAGLLNPQPELSRMISRLQQETDVVFIADITANLRDAQWAPHYDMILGTTAPDAREALRPDLLVSFGGPAVSKSLKLFLRKHQPAEHWHLQRSTLSVDTFQCLTKTLPVRPLTFFEQLADLPRESVDRDYQTIWARLEERARYKLATFLQKVPHCEFSAMGSILKQLPPDSNLQIGNSFIIRMANFIGLQERGDIRVNSNRGTSGIDGTMSTAVGAALATDKLTTFITGDLAFFYDRNALWSRRLPANLRIVIINNKGGGIFRLLDGAGDLPELADYFETAHDLSARNTAHDHNLAYTHCDAPAALMEALGTFWQPGKNPRILEIDTDKEINSRTFLKFKSIMKEIK